MSEPHPTVPVAIVSPVRDESKYIRLTLDAMVAQTVWPAEWIIVDDGSSDDTPDIVRSYQKDYPFIRLITRDDRGKRVLGSGVIEAFNFGRAQLQSDYAYICKLDGDMSFDERYLETMLEAFAADPRLAAVSGKVYRPEDDGLVEEYIIDEVVAGQFKFYRRSAFEEIGGFTQTILWDGIDIHKCRMKGWSTRSIRDDRARLYHHRMMGSSDKNVYKGRVRLGRGIWFMGYHPAYAVASGMFRMGEKPYVIGGLIIIGAYFYAALKRDPRYDDLEFRRDLQAWQMQRLREVGQRLWRRVTGRAGDRSIAG
ncbi:glycosyltransferase family A protein [uncultured Abyssibacter sp.]|uniref:glycosyltransferase n=1 Tax=uncultured Abyssibacter sp. TaxID=2320202 RepID=UPI0032B1D07D